MPGAHVQGKGRAAPGASLLTAVLGFPIPNLDIRLLAG